MYDGLWMSFIVEFLIEPLVWRLCDHSWQLGKQEELTHLKYPLDLW
jgi:hypothetical protein